MECITGNHAGMARPPCTKRQDTRPARLGHRSVGRSAPVIRTLAVNENLAFRARLRNVLHTIRSFKKIKSTGEKLRVLRGLPDPKPSFEKKKTKSRITQRQSVHFAHPESLPSRSVSPLPEPGKRVRLLEMIGHGSVGAVFKAEYTRKVHAIKLLHGFTGSKNLPDSRPFVSIFLSQPTGNKLSKARKLLHHEAEVLNKLGNHENIVRFVRTFHDSRNRVEAIVLEFGGCKLSSYILAQQAERGSSRTPVDITIRIMEQGLKGLDFIHKKGVVHLDIKPDNLLVNAEKQLKICDFGLAEFIPYHGFAQSDHWTGTPGYISPERFEKVKIYNHLSDVYSFGIVCNRLISYSEADIPSCGFTNMILLPLLNLSQRMSHQSMKERFSAQKNLEDLKQLCLTDK